MEIHHSVCAGLDVHKTSIVACVRQVTSSGIRYKIEKFGTKNSDLAALFDWLASFDCTHVVMESTGVYWKPVWRALHGGFELCLANAHEVKNVPGRKSDVKDAQWLAELLAHGLIRSSYVPELDQQELRELTRTVRKLSQERGRHKQRIQKVLESCGIKLDSVISDILGRTGRAIVEAIIKGEKISPAELADLAQGDARKKWLEIAKSLQAYVRPHDRFMLETHLAMYDAVQTQIARLRARVEEVLPPPFDEAAQRLCEIPGMSREWATEILAETGIDMSVFENADHFVSWARLCPRLDSTAGKSRSTRTLKGSQWLKPTLVQLAWAAVRTKSSSLRSTYYRVRSRAGAKKAIVAMAAKILRIIYSMLSSGLSYDDQKPAQMTEDQRTKAANRHLEALHRLGVKVKILAAA
jgi:transposase